MPASSAVDPTGPAPNRRDAAAAAARPADAPPIDQAEPGPSVVDGSAADPTATDGRAAPGAPSEAPTEAESIAIARALSSPLRLRVLRLCAFDARTNKELAQLLDVNPGTMLHHVRTLVDTGLLAPDPDRAGARGAREVPYRATGRSWRAPKLPNQSAVLLETMRQQIVGVDPEKVETTWLGLRLNKEHLDELETRLYSLLEEFKERGPDPDGEAYSLVAVIHPDLNPRAPDSAIAQSPAGERGESAADGVGSSPAD